MSERIPIEQLKPGMVIIKVTAQNGPVKIKKSGLVSSVDMVSALAEMGVQEVEVDPDISVQIETPKIAKSKTQQLVEDSNNYSNHLDHNISEQFNRSLFLPSVQELPEAWQYYGKKSGLVALVLLGGFCVGWTISQYPVWKAALLNTVSQPAPQVYVAPQNTPLSEPQKTATDQTDDTPNAAEDPQIASAQSSVAQSAQQTKSQQPAAVVEQIPEPEPVILNKPAEPVANISPDLLKRFEQAVASMETDAPQKSKIEVSAINDVPPVEKLPAWVLTKLPSMAFSAHMYNSEPEKRWVRVNGKRVVEGQEIDRGLRVIGIEPQHVILTFEGQEFSMEALSDW